MKESSDHWPVLTAFRTLYSQIQCLIALHETFNDLMLYRDLCQHVISSITKRRCVSVSHVYWDSLCHCCPVLRFQSTAVSAAVRHSAGRRRVVFLSARICQLSETDRQRTTNQPFTSCTSRISKVVQLQTYSRKYPEYPEIPGISVNLLGRFRLQSAAARRVFCQEIRSHHASVPWTTLHTDWRIRFQQGVLT